MIHRFAVNSRRAAPPKQQRAAPVRKRVLTRRRTSFSADNQGASWSKAKTDQAFAAARAPASSRARLVFAVALLIASSVFAVPPAPNDVSVKDHPWDGGDSIDLTISYLIDVDNKIKGFDVERSVEADGLFTSVEQLPLPEKWVEFQSKPPEVIGGVLIIAEQIELSTSIAKLRRDQPYYFRVRTLGVDGETSDWVTTQEAVIPTRQWFDGGRFWLLVITVIVCGSIIGFILWARTGRTFFVRKIAGLEAVEEAVGRATEMGRSSLFIPGIQDMNDIQTIAGLTILSRVSERAAEYDSTVEVPTSKSLVMTAARETVQAAFLAAGRPDAYNDDLIYYVTDEQFGYVAYLSGMMVREKPAACFYMGAFFAESLILAETGNEVGAIQVAGTAQPAQLPFFVAACDYTLIGEEFFAASAYLSGDPDQLGSLKGQDVGKLVVLVLIVLGCGLLTVGNVFNAELVHGAGEYLRDSILSAGG